MLAQSKINFWNNIRQQYSIKTIKLNGLIMYEVCPLCLSIETKLLYSWHENLPNRDFQHCNDCDLVFVPTRFHISEEDQLKRYESHNNDLNDPDYVKFLSRVLNELKPYIKPESNALDYGSGPGPALAKMLHSEGLTVDIYDPFFQPNRSVLKKKYDIVTCTETAEHFSNPREDFLTLDSILVRGGYLGIMTSMIKKWDEFPEWYYHRDPTHISFYSLNTMEWIAGNFSWELYSPRDHVVLFKKMYNRKLLIQK